jgi:dienelactone hydrolase
MRKVVVAVLTALLGAFAGEASAVDLGLPKEVHAKVQPPGRGLFQGSYLYAPPGAGPHPALVLSHTCAGVRNHLFEAADLALAAGFVVLTLDHLGPRGHRTTCPPTNPVSVTEYAQDAIAGLKHLKTLPFVDPRRIAHVGFSYGAMAGLRIASASFRKQSLGGEGFAAVVALYPWCNSRNAGGADYLYNFFDDTDTPLLLLLGADDDDTPPATCVEQAEKNAKAGLPVDWKVYPGATHLFDDSLLKDAPFSFQRGGRTITYRYNAQATQESWQAAREFLLRRLGP